MGFVKTFEQIMANVRATVDFYDAEMLHVFWETKPEIIAKLLPPPLKPANHPMAMAFIAFYPRSNINLIYHESGLYVNTVYNGEEGYYCLAMSVTNDMAMAGGREVFGLPKKMANIHFKREGDSVEGWTERQEIRFMEVRARLTGKFNDPAAQDIVMATGTRDNGGIKTVGFIFKHFPAPEGGAFDYNPRLIRQETVMKPKEMQFGEAEIIFKSSDYDPWAEVEVVKTLGAIYTKGDNSMISGTVVTEVGPMEFVPYAFLKWDMK